MTERFQKRSMTRCGTIRIGARQGVWEAHPHHCVICCGGRAYAKGRVAGCSEATVIGLLLFLLPGVHQLGGGGAGALSADRLPHHAQG